MSIENDESSSQNGSSDLVDLAPEAENLAGLTARGIIAETLLQIVVKDIGFNEFARELLALALRVIPSETGSIFEIDHDNGTIFFRTAEGACAEDLKSFSIPIGQGIVGHVAESRQPLLVSDIESSTVHLRTVEKAVGFEARNILAMPLVVRGKIYGVIELLNRKGEPSFSHDDLALLGYFSEYAALALEARFMIAWGAARAKSFGPEGERGGGSEAA